MNLCPLLENNRDSVKRKNACAGARELENIFMMLGTFQEIVHMFIKSYF